MGDAAPTLIADAQFTNVKILRPFPGFESVYQGKDAEAPILFPGGRDPAAGSPGYSANLAAGLSVPFGARVVIWVPLAIRFNGQVSDITLYRYRVIWRFRNLRDFRLRPRGEPRKPFHLPIQRSGIPDTSFAPPQPRVIIPAASKVLAFEQAEPATPLGRGVINIRDEEFIPRASGTVEGLLPGGQPAAIAQGLFDPNTPATSALAADPIFQPFWFDAEGDEMIILAYRDNIPVSPNPGSKWDFTAGGATGDRPFSNIYGTDNGSHPALLGAGIYVLTGMNP